MTNQHHPKTPEVQQENLDGAKDALARSPQEKMGKRPVEERVLEARVQQLLERMDKEAKSVFERRSEECIALWKEVREQVLASAMPTREVVKEDARTLRQRATDTGMPDKELALETIGKADYLPRV